ncbi:cytochrome c oxidase assembly protein [Nonomuraea antimicrobica]|uniref:cytochrome c oxidase assembly protein n=1 Tax=Nonomuraea antimicrobica TaxID=561173 RepID=UPI0031EC14BF
MLRPPVPGDGRARRLYAGSALIAAAVVLLAVALARDGSEPEIAGLPEAGPLTEWGLPLVRLGYQVCAVAVVGTLLAASVLAPAGSSARAVCLRAAGRWALGWAVTACLGYVLTVSEVSALPVADLLADPATLGAGLSISQARALALVAAVSLAVGASTRLGRTPATRPPAASARLGRTPATRPPAAPRSVAGVLGRPPAAFLLVVAAAGLLPPVFVGHAASAGDHDLAVSALAVHVVAVSLWVGGLGAVLVHLRGRDDLPVVLPRFSTIALCCFAAVAVSGVAAAWVRMNAVPDLWQTTYGRLLLAKTAALAALALFGRAHRRRTVARAADRTVRATFARLATGELVVMAVALALAVALSRTAPPGTGDGGHDPGVLGYDLPGLTPVALLTEARPDPLVLLLLALPAIGYLVGVRRVREWPLGRTLAWYAGLAAMGLVLLGGVGAYARATAPAHALQHTVLAVAVPLLLCLGAPLTLAARATTPASQYGRVRAHLTVPPALLAVVPVAYLVGFPLLYRTGWLAWSLSGHVPHVLTQLSFLAAGLVVFWPLAGVDPLPRPLSRPVRAVLLGAVAVVLLAVGAFLLVTPPVAAEWFVVAAPPGGPDLFAGQRLAGAVYLLVAFLVLVPLAVRMTRPRREKAHPA